MKYSAFYLKIFYLIVYEEFIDTIYSMLQQCFKKNKIFLQKTLAKLVKIK